MASKSIIETSGIDLTGEYVGQTKKKVQEKLGQAKGSVLFIDEAYDLGKGSFGEEAMTTLLAAMTSPEYEGMVVIIIAGYNYEIDQMLDRNSGLKSRFTEIFEFEDWTPVACSNFLLQTAASEAFLVNEEWKPMLVNFFTKLAVLPGWANARDVIQIWKDCKKNRASRVTRENESQKSIQRSEFYSALESMIIKRTPQTSAKTSKEFTAFAPPADTVIDDMGASSIQMTTGKQEEATNAVLIT